jgi:hypothetical protein
MIVASAFLVLALQSPPAVAEPPRVSPTPQATTKPAMRPLQEGESALEGLLQRVECPRGRPVRFTMRVGDKVERFEAARLTDVDYIAHTSDFKGPMTCGGRGKGDLVRLTWKEDGTVRRVVAVEFLPGK